MKKVTQKNIWLLPVAVWIILIPIIEKAKVYPNPLMECSWYSNEEYLSDIFLYYKAVCVVAIGILMLAFLVWQVKSMKKSGLTLIDFKIFIPAIAYLAFVLFSSLLSEYGYFCVHGMPEHLESVWVWISYIIALIYCCYIVVAQCPEKTLNLYMYIGAALVGLVCVLQFFKIDIYQLLRGGEEYTLTFEEGMVYGSFYSPNYVGYYVLLVSPLFILFLILSKDWKARVISAVLAIAMLIALVGARSTTSVIIYVAVCMFAAMFLLLKHLKENRRLYIPLIAIAILVSCACVFAIPKINTYMRSCDTEKKDLENIFTLDECVEVDYRGQKLYVDMIPADNGFAFNITDQNQVPVSLQYMESENGYYYYQFMDERFAELSLAPARITKDPDLYGFALFLEDKNWCFTNQLTEDGTYYYYTDTKKLTKLTEDTPSANFTPLINKSSLANGRGYIWNKTITLLKDYLFLGSGADTFALAFPNDDIVDRFNNGYGSMIITKPHSLYLQIAVQSGILSLVCFLIFYAWYFIESLRLYFRKRLDNPVEINGFAIMLGTFGYMLSGLTNDSTVTVAPLYWAMLGIGIGINHHVKTKS